MTKRHVLHLLSILTEVQERFEYLGRVFSNMPVTHEKTASCTNTEEMGIIKVAMLNHQKTTWAPTETSMVSTNGIYYHRSVDSKYGWKKAV